jgi:hypothetical protein
MAKQFLIDGRLTHEESRQATAPLALDLTSAFKVMREELIRELHKAKRAGETPDAAIRRVLEMFDPQGPETEELFVAKEEKKYEIGDAKKRPDGTWWEKTGTYSWKRIKAPEGETEDEDSADDEESSFIDKIPTALLDELIDDILADGEDLDRDAVMDILGGMSEGELIDEMESYGIPTDFTMGDLPDPDAEDELPPEPEEPDRPRENPNTLLARKRRAYIEFYTKEYGTERNKAVFSVFSMSEDELDKAMASRGLVASPSDQGVLQDFKDYAQASYFKSRSDIEDIELRKEAARAWGQQLEANLDDRYMSDAQRMIDEAGIGEFTGPVPNVRTPDEEREIRREWSDYEDKERERKRAEREAERKLKLDDPDAIDTPTPGSRRRDEFLRAHPEMASLVGPAGEKALREHKEFEVKDWTTPEFSEKVNLVLDNNSPTMDIEDIVDEPDKLLEAANTGYSFGTRSYKGIEYSKENMERITRKFVEDVDAMIENSSIVYRFHENEEILLNSWLDEGRTKNLFETGTGHGSISKPSRTSWERKIVDFVNPSTAGTSTTLHLLEPAERPSYAMMGISAAFRSGSGTHYGRSSLVMKDDVKDRSTFHLSNSSAELGCFTRGGASKLAEPDRRSAFGRNLTEAQSCENGRAYLEAQIYGGVDLRTDVDHIKIPKSEWEYLPETKKEKWRKVAKKYNLNIADPDGSILVAGSTGSEPGGHVGSSEIAIMREAITRKLMDARRITREEAERRLAGTLDVGPDLDYWMHALKVGDAEIEKVRGDIDRVAGPTEIKKMLKEKIGSKVSDEAYDAAMSAGLLTMATDGFKIKTSKFTYRYYDDDRTRVAPPKREAGAGGPVGASGIPRSAFKVGEFELREDGVYKKTSKYTWSRYWAKMHLSESDLKYWEEKMEEKRREVGS